MDGDRVLPDNVLSNMLGAEINAPADGGGGEFSDGEAAVVIGPGMRTLRMPGQSGRRAPQRPMSAPRMEEAMPLPAPGYSMYPGYAPPAMNPMNYPAPMQYPGYPPPQYFPPPQPFMPPFNPQGMKVLGVDFQQQAITTSFGPIPIEAELAQKLMGLAVGAVRAHLESSLTAALQSVKTLGVEAKAAPLVGRKGKGSGVSRTRVVKKPSIKGVRQKATIASGAAVHEG